jgi:hypothetical protein
LPLEIQLPGTEFLDAETGGQKSALETANVHRDRKSGDDTGEILAENGLFGVVYEMRGLGRLDGGVRSHIRTGLRFQFPANREINRELCDFAAFGGGFLVKSRCAAATFRKIP